MILLLLESFFLAFVFVFGFQMNGILGKLYSMDPIITGQSGVDSSKNGLGTFATFNFYQIFIRR